MKTMLSWSRWLADSLWGTIRAGASDGGSLLGWFARNWLVTVIFLVAAGVVCDWLIWMIRWRPYWLWFNKRQIIYEDAPKRRPNRPRQEPPRFQGYARRAMTIAQDDDFEDDPFRDDTSEAVAGEDDEDLWGLADDESKSAPKKKKSEDVEYF